MKYHCQIGDYVILIDFFAHAFTILHLKKEILLLTVVEYVFHITPSINLSSPPPSNIINRFLYLAQIQGDSLS